jgi:hypothetical protein
MMRDEILCKRMFIYYIKLMLIKKISGVIFRVVMDIKKPMKIRIFLYFHVVKKWRKQRASFEMSGTSTQRQN